MLPARENAIIRPYTISLYTAAIYVITSPSYAYVRYNDMGQAKDIRRKVILVPPRQTEDGPS
jgi:hypothetical protein